MEILNAWTAGTAQIEDAIEQVTALRGESITSGYVANQARSETLLGILFAYRGSLSASIQYFERARALFTQVGNIKRIATCDLNLGESYRYKGDFIRARQYFERAYESYHALGDDLHGEANALCNRGQMFLSLDDLENASKDLHQALVLTGQIHDADQDVETLICEIHRGLTMLYIAQGRLDDALAEAQAAYSIADRTQKPFHIGYANRAMGQILTAVSRNSENNHEKAADPDVYFQRANEAFREINAEGEVARTMFEHATSLARRGRRMMAAKKLQLAMVIFSRLGMIDDAAKAAEAQREML
ncbi:MAG: tetratricopeptide repeat protein [Anaerolineae bacterium]|nr:tetratricopeptide repeat protein [Anaerolineae bacterium]